MTACGGTRQPSTDGPLTSSDAGPGDLDDGGTINPSDGGTPADAGDGGPSDAGAPPDAGITWPPSIPPDIDCDDPETAQTGWCAELCTTADIDLGWGEKVTYRTSPARKRTTRTCVPMYGNTQTYFWRAPYDGQWVFSTYGAEGGALLASIENASCEEQSYFCPPTGSNVVTLKAGDPIVAMTLHHERREGKGIPLHQLTIVPKTEVESGADCVDGADNDADQYSDCEDPDCATDSGCNTPACAHEILPSTFPQRVEGELTTEYQNRYVACADGYTREKLFAWRAPRAGRFVFDATKSHFLTSLGVRRDSCVGPDLPDCRFDDPYRLDWESVAMGVDATAGEWFIILVGGTDDTLSFWDVRTGQPREHYVLEIREATDEICSDAIDNDGNGKVDSSDPACMSEE